MSEPQGPEHYAGERLREALAADPRVSDISLLVHIVAGNVFVTGQVPTQERIDARPSHPDADDLLEAATPW